MFYHEWTKAKQTGKDCSKFILSFLEYTPESISAFLSGNTDEVVNAIKLLLSVSIDEFLDSIKSDSIFSSKDIFQYSNLDNAIVSLCNILNYESESLSFFEAGQKLTHSDRELACVKYGENHIKLAEAFSLVKIEKIDRKSACRASITTLGSVFTSLTSEERIQLVRRLAIRNPFVKSLLFNAQNGYVAYCDLASQVLFGQTITRRKHNVEIIIDLILEDHPIKNNIRW